MMTMTRAIRLRKLLGCASSSLSVMGPFIETSQLGQNGGWFHKEADAYQKALYQAVEKL
jgi:hypothetical protein